MHHANIGTTSGHVGELTAGAWHPKDPNTFITSSNDSTVRYEMEADTSGPRFNSFLGRIWDVENKMKQKTVIVVKSKERGTRTKITTCNYSHDAKLIVNGASPPFIQAVRVLIRLSSWTRRDPSYLVNIGNIC